MADPRNPQAERLRRPGKEARGPFAIIEPMKTVPLSLLIAAVLLASATAGVTTWVLADAGEPNARGPAAEDAVANAALLARVDELAAENRELHQRLEGLELRPPAAPPSEPVALDAREPLGGYVSLDAFEEFQTEVRAKLSKQPQVATESPEFKEQVASALVDVRKEENFEKVRKQQEARSARLDEDVEKVREWLDLEPYQADEMRQALLDQYEREDEVRRLWEEGEEGEVLGELKAAAGAAFRTDAEAILTPTQFETFWEGIGRGGGKD